MNTHECEHGRIIGDMHDGNGMVHLDDVSPCNRTGHLNCRYCQAAQADRVGKRADEAVRVCDRIKTTLDSTGPMDDVAYWRHIASLVDQRLSAAVSFVADAALIGEDG